MKTRSLAKEMLNILESYRTEDMLLENLERQTLIFIADDAFDELPDEIQDLVYPLDNYELNGLSNADIKINIAELVKQIKLYLGSIERHL